MTAEDIVGLFIVIAVTAYVLTRIRVVGQPEP